MERELVEWLAARLPVGKHVAVGLGDDAAVLRPPPGSEVVVTTDMLMDGVDFVVGEVDLELVGRKALAVNLSDLAAMAATPVAAFVSLALPRSFTIDDAKRLYAGMLPLAAEFDVAIAGGDTNTWPAPLCISITAIGVVEAGRSWQRNGAKAGDVVLATGSFGGSILSRHLQFTPRVREARVIAEKYEVHAAIDVSDGLSLDLSRLAHASGCGAEIDLAWVPIAHDAVTFAASSGKSPVEHALGDGEDFELLIVVAPEEANRLIVDRSLFVPLTRIGRMIETPGLFAVDVQGNRSPLVPRGYEHGST